MGECFAVRRGVRVGGLGERVSSGIPVEEERGSEKGEAGEVGDGTTIGTATSVGEWWWWGRPTRERRSDFVWDMGEAGAGGGGGGGGGRWCML